MIPRHLAFGTLLVAVACNAVGYELATHARITFNALLQSDLVTDPSLFAALGIAKGQGANLGNIYFDVSTASMMPRETQNFDWNEGKMPALDKVEMDQLRTLVPGWLMSGAVREDDSAKREELFNRVIFHAQREPLDDPYGNINRWCNHFFDPYNNRPLTASGLAEQVCRDYLHGSAPVWATGFAGPFSSTGEPVEDLGRRNHFTVLDAREAMWRALTGHDRSLTQRLAPDKPTRDAWWATTFRALGDVLHLNQDMGQPQHTRNEDHGVGHAAWYEKYIDGRAKGNTTITYDYVAGKLTAENATPLVYGGYPLIPAFDRYADFWSTGTGAATMTGRGLADYSSRGFFTPAKNFGNREYPSPPSDSAAYQRTVVAAANGWKEEHLTGTVPDMYEGTTSRPIRMTRRGIWGDAAEAARLGNASVIHSLDRGSFDDRAELLIPRAVAYSAGLLNHFFRGRMEISLPSAGFFGIADHAPFAPPAGATDVTAGYRGFDRVKLRLRNTTPPITSRGAASSAQEMKQGLLVAVLKYRRGLCYDDVLQRWPADAATARLCVDLGEEVVVSEPVAITEATAIPMAGIDAPDSREFTFAFPGRQMPINAWNVTLHVVYRGRLGTEADAVVAATRDVSEPTFVTFMNSTDQVTVNGNFYTPSALAANQPLFDQVRPECRKGVRGSYTLHPACYNRPDDFYFTAGASAVSIGAYGTGAVPPRRFIRVALLTDTAQPAALYWRPGDVSCTFDENPIVVPGYRARFDVQEQWEYGLPSKLRAVNGWRSMSCFEDVGIVPTARKDAPFGQLDALLGDELAPVPAVISGW